MDETLMIDNLKISPQYASRIQIRNNEFFECDWCGRLCQMPMDEYKTYPEEVILKSKYRCKGCARKMGRGRPLKYNEVTKEKILDLKTQGLNNRAIARHFEMSEANLYDFLKKFGLSKTRQKVNKDTNKDSVLIEPSPSIEPAYSQLSPSLVETLDKNHFTDVSNMVEHPPHYTAGGIECIDAIMAAVTGLTPQEAVCVANVLKYTWRFKHKNGKQDLKKAEWYLKRLTDLQEG